MLLGAGRRLAYACIARSRQQFVTRSLVCNRQTQPAFHQAVVQHRVPHPTSRPIMSAAPDAGPTAAASAANVRTTLRQLLPTVDMDTTSERQIREMLAGKLGTAMDPFKKLIKEEIDRWLTETAVGGAGGAGSSGDDDFASSLDPVGKRKRAAGEAAGAPAAKVARSAATGATPQGGVQLDNKGLKWLSVSSFKGQQRVDLRNYFVNKATGAVAPTKKGVSFSQPDWAALQAVIPAVNKALDDSDDTFVAELPSNRRATVSVFSGKLQIGVREYYEEGGELKPSMKGLNMLPDEWEVFCEAVPDINKQLTAAAAPAAAAAGAPAPAAAAAGPRKAAAAAAGGGGGGAAAAAAGAGGAAAAAEVQLGGKKRAAISMFTGSACVDLRECYEKDGELRPGKKGIMLRPEQWRMLVEAAGAITDALTAHNTRYTLELGNKRRVTISDFKNVWYVGVREYYEKNGQLMPGQKGLSMNREQWQKLVAGMDTLTAQLG